MNENPRDTISSNVISPDGLLKIEFDEFEMRASHWVCNPRITDIKNGKVLLDLWGTQWDGDASFENAGEVTFSFRHYPGDIPGFLVRINPQVSTFFFEDQPEQIEPLSVLRRRLDQRYSERKQLYRQPQNSAVRATRSERLWQKVELLMMLLTLSILFVIGGVW